MMIAGYMIDSFNRYATKYDDGTFAREYIDSGNYYGNHRDPEYNFRLNVLGKLSSMAKHIAWAFDPDDVTPRKIIDMMDIGIVRNELLMCGFDDLILSRSLSDVMLKMMLFNLAGIFTLKRKKIKTNASIPNDHTEMLDGENAIINGNPCVHFNDIRLDRTYKGVNIYSHINALSTYRFRDYYRYFYGENGNPTCIYTNGYSVILPNGKPMSDGTLAGIKEIIRDYFRNN